ncbi:S-type pyocin domain-containing protein [Pseudomonas anuradhapurensis]
MSQHGSVELADSIVNAPRLPPVPQYFWGHNRIPSHYLASTFRPGHLVIDLVPLIEQDKHQVKQAYEERQTTLEQELDQALQDHAGSLAGLDEVQSIERRIAAADQLATLLGARLQSARQQADSFFGRDPEHRTFNEFLAVARGPTSPADPRQSWLDSYRAAFEAKHLQRQQSRLTSHRYSLNAALSTARWKASHNRDIDRMVNQLEHALINTHAASHAFEQAQGALQTLLTAFERHQHEDIAEQAALEYSRELEREISDALKARTLLMETYATRHARQRQLTASSQWIDFTLNRARTASSDRKAELTKLQTQVQENTARYAAISAMEQAAVRQLQARADSAITAAFDEQHLLAALSGHTPSNTPATFNAWTASTRHALVLTTSSGGTALFEAIWQDLGKALARAAAQLLASAAQGIVRYVPLMLYSARLGDGERMGVSVPLVQMTPDADLTQEAHRRAGQALELPLRMNAVPQGTQTELYLAATDGSGLLRDVRVRQAQWDAAHGAYRFTAEGPGGATLLWHPATPPTTLDELDHKSGNMIPGATIVEDLQKHRPGSIAVPPQADIRTFPELPELQIDDYVIIFPADSGLAPIYVMLRSPRNIPGVASGNGVLTPDRVLDAASTAAGAPIPTRIAERLRGRRFSRFDKLKEAIWKEIAEDEIFGRHIAPPMLDDMKRGLAPYARRDQRVGKRVKLEIHHKQEIAKGGAVYDFDNLVLMTPQVHINHHRGNDQ